MGAGVFEDELIVYIEPRAVVWRKIELVACAHFRDKIPVPTRREVIGVARGGIAVFAPVKIDLFIRASQGRHTLEFVIVKVLCFKSSGPAGRSQELRPVYDFVQGQAITGA